MGNVWQIRLIGSSDFRAGQGAVSSAINTIRESPCANSQNPITIGFCVKILAARTAINCTLGGGAKGQPL